MRGNAPIPILIAPIIAIALGLIVGYALFPTLTNEKDPCAVYNASHDCVSWTNSTPYAGTETSFLNLATLFFALGMGLIGLIIINGIRQNL